MHVYVFYPEHLFLSPQKSQPSLLYPPQYYCNQSRDILGGPTEKNKESDHKKCNERSNKGATAIRN